MNKERKKPMIQKRKNDIKQVPIYSDSGFRSAIAVCGSETSCQAGLLANFFT